VRSLPPAKIESSPVSDTSCPAELIYDLIDRRFSCRKCPKPVTIRYTATAGLWLASLDGVLMRWLSDRVTSPTIDYTADIHIMSHLSDDISVMKGAELGS